MLTLSKERKLRALLFCYLIVVELAAMGVTMVVESHKVVEMLEVVKGDNATDAHVEVVPSQLSAQLRAVSRLLCRARGTPGKQRKHHHEHRTCRATGMRR